ncbi:MAG TPA: hypothetical protein DCE00_02870 [Firmicutes bacterium]|jgi:putative inorganic carbon (HCO3(-)) transporter|nr:hypothetical protein [Bacillota bacterium]
MTDLGIVLTISSPYLTFIPGMAILFVLSEKKVPIYLNPLNTGLFLLFVWAFIAGIVNMSIISTIASLGLLLHWCLAVYLQDTLQEEKSVSLFLAKVWRFSLFTALLGIVEKIASYFFDLTWIASYYLNDPIEYVYRIYSTYGNPNVAGGWFAAMIILTLYFFEHDNYQNKRKYLFYLLSFLTALVFSGSRGATLALEAALLSYALLSKNKTTRTVIFSTFFLIIILAVLSPEINYNHPLNSRFPIWLKSFKLFLEKPFLGWGIFGILAQTKKIHTHNIWFTILTMLGVVGFSLYLWIKYYIYKSLILLYNNKQQLVPLLVAMQVFMVTHGVVDFIIMTPQGGVMFFATAAITVGLARSYEINPELELAEAWRIVKTGLSDTKSIKG